jgi:hypothetical protein
MNRLVVMVMSLGLAVMSQVPTTAFAGQNPVAMARVAAEAKDALPMLDRFEDEGQMLELLSPSVPFMGDATVLLVYKDEEANVRRLTVHPAQLAAGGSATVDTFLGEMDPAFLSFVRSSIGDRLIRIKTRATPLDRVEAALFFPSKRVQVAEGARALPLTSEQEYIPLTVD